MQRNGTLRVQVKLRRAGGEAVAGLGGELDFAEAAAVGRKLRRLLEEHRGLTVDLAQLRFMDSSGLHLLAGLRALAAEQDWPLEVTGARGAVARLLAVAAG